MSVNKPKVFLGGTCNESLWRSELIPMLHIDYFNPVVQDWTLECQEEEIKQRSECDFVLYCITPKMTGFFSIAEVIDDSNKRPQKTIFLQIDNDDNVAFSRSQIYSLNAVKKIIITNGGIVLDTLQQVADFLNAK